MAGSLSTSSFSMRKRFTDDDSKKDPVLCDYGLRVSMWTIWTSKNPERRFYSCLNFQIRKHNFFVRCELNGINYLNHCGFFLLQARGYEYFLWYDLKMCPKAKAVINELKRESKMLKNEIKEKWKLKGENKMFKIKCIVVFYCNHLLVCCT